MVGVMVVIGRQVAHTMIGDTVTMVVGAAGLMGLFAAGVLLDARKT